MNDGAELIEVHVGDFGNLQPQAETQREPVAQRLAQFPLATGERLVACPDALKAGNLLPSRCHRLR